jgi:hypothetical protein
MPVGVEAALGQQTGADNPKEAPAVSPLPPPPPPIPLRGLEPMASLSPITGLPRPPKPPKPAAVAVAAAKAAAEEAAVAAGAPATHQPTSTTQVSPEAADLSDDDTDDDAAFEEVATEHDSSPPQDRGEGLVTAAQPEAKEREEANLGARLEVETEAETDAASGAIADSSHRAGGRWLRRRSTSAENQTQPNTQTAAGSTEEHPESKSEQQTDTESKRGGWLRSSLSGRRSVSSESEGTEDIAPKMAPSSSPAAAVAASVGAAASDEPSASLDPMPPAIFMALNEQQVSYTPTADLSRTALQRSVAGLLFRRR